MRKPLLLIALLFAALDARGAGPVAPFEMEGGPSGRNPVDAPVLAALRRRGLEPAHCCSDAVFLRRVYLDVIGTLPDADEARAFLLDRRAEKRAVLIDSLLERTEFAEYQALKWCDILRVKAEFPVNLWPNAVQAYHRYIRDSIAANVPYDRFVRELLTSSGSNFRVPAVNFYRAIQGRDAASIAQAVALTFMGARIDKWPADRRAGLAAFFSRVAYKKTAEWKEEIVFPDPTPAGPLEAVFPDGVRARLFSDEDPRVVFADWLLAPGNPWFARNIVNRVWYWLLGRGVVHEPDDIRDDNPPSIPELLVCLESQFVNSGCDLKGLFRVILNSRTYQQSPIPRTERPVAAALFASYAVRRLDAEVLIDALCGLDGRGEGYSSAIPEPFTYIPDSERAISLADGSITSPLLEMFGRPPRDTGLESERNNQPTEAQRLYLLNSSDVQKRIERSPRLIKLFARTKGDPIETIAQVYLTILSREPTPAEIAVVRQYFGVGRNPREGAADLVWALVNSKEFLYRH